MQVLPPKELSPYIKHYLFLESDDHAVKKLRLFSDGNTGMVFCFRNTLIAKANGANELHYLPTAFIYGQISEYKDLFVMNEASLLIVVFQPYGINRLLGIAANEIKDSIIPVEDIFGTKAIAFHESLLVINEAGQRLQILNKFFTSLQKAASLANHVLLECSLDFICKNKGDITVQQLMKHTGYTERHIERTFRESIGISPKKFGNIVKLHSFLRMLKQDLKRQNLTSICYETGYSDQSHLIKEFRKYTGITPTQYLNDTSRLAVNFMKFNHPSIPMSGLYNPVN